MMNKSTVITLIIGGICFIVYAIGLILIPIYL